MLKAIISAVLRYIEGPMSQKAMEEALDKQAAGTNLDWRNSIVDLMKLTGQDSSLPARENLAREIGYVGKLDGSAEMNLYLHREVMARLAKSS